MPPPSARPPGVRVLCAPVALIILTVVTFVSVGCDKSVPNGNPVAKAETSSEPKFTKELAALRLGIKLTKLAEANFVFPDAQQKARLETEAAALAAALKLDMGPVKPPPPVGDPQRDAAAHLAFLIDPKQPVAVLSQQIVDKYGRRCQAYFDLPIKTSLAVLCYLPNKHDDVQRSALKAFEDAARDTQATDLLYADYADALRKAAVDQHRLGLHASVLLGRIEGYAEAQTKQQR